MPFAATDDVAVRLGRTLTDAEAAMAEQVIESVTDQIVAAANETAAWAEELEPVPATLKTLCVEKVIQVGTNPNGLEAESESLGAYSHARTFQATTAPAVFLTDEEKRMVRIALRGSTFRSVTLETPYSGTAAEEMPELPLP